MGLGLIGCVVAEYVHGAGTVIRFQSLVPDVWARDGAGGGGRDMRVSVQVGNRCEHVPEAPEEWGFGFQVRVWVGQRRIFIAQDNCPLDKLITRLDDATVPPYPK